MLSLQYVPFRSQCKEDILTDTGPGMPGILHPLAGQFKRPVLGNKPMRRYVCIDHYHQPAESASMHESPGCRERHFVLAKIAMRDTVVSGGKHHDNHEYFFT